MKSLIGTEVTQLNDKSTNIQPYIVGVGASAGSLEALEHLFEQVNIHSGLVYVVIQHLSPKFKSYMHELLGKKTKVGIKHIKDDMPIEIDTIYLAPPRTFINIENGKFKVQELSNDTGLTYPIDHFFSSLAKYNKEKSIAVVLSGKGNDGSSGLSYVYDTGGTVIVQTEESAKFMEMPNYAIQTGKVDHVVRPEEMASLFEQIVLDKKINFSSEGKEEETNFALEQICSLIQRKSGINFTSYKRNTILRRIEKRIQINQLPFTSLLEYKEYLISHPEEIMKLQQDLLINVTEFFRDEQAFKIIQNEVIPVLIQQKIKQNESDIRIWVAGCSTGEEAYSLAILIREYLDLNDLHFRVKIFATDLDRDAIKKASAGQYGEQVIVGISKERLERFFQNTGYNYVVKKEIREMIIFAPHNIAKDSPFVNIDLVSCRNMLIYFQADLQQKILSMFHFALRREGYMFLGPSETIGKLTDLFQPIHPKWKIFKYLDTEKQDYSNLLRTQTIRRTEKLEGTKMYTQYPEANATKQLNPIYETLLEHFVSPCMIVNENNDIVLSGGNVQRFLRMPIGNATFNVLKMVSTNLSVAIGTALKKVREEQIDIHYDHIQVFSDQKDEVVDLVVKPFKQKNESNTPLCIVFLNEVKKEKTKDPSYETKQYDLEKNVQQLISDLETEISYTKESLQTMIEELETSNEEYQSTNEELIAANEELQSSNEELQSVNEELVNVNVEHEKKIQELRDLNNDIDNLLISTNIATLFLDEQLNIKRFTPEVTKLINLLDVDIGRPLSHLSHNMDFDHLIEEAKDVLQSHQKKEHYIESNEGRWYRLRLHPYRTKENFIHGVVITFLDVTEMKMMNEALKMKSFALEQSPASIMMVDEDGLIDYVNHTYEKYVKMDRIDLLGQSIFNLYESEIARETLQEAWEVVKQGKRWDGTSMFVTDGSEKWEQVTFMPIVNESFELKRFLRVAEDITEKRNTEDLLRKSEMLSALGEMAAGIAHEIRNPLTALKGFLQLMQAEDKGDQQYLGIMANEFNRIELIINELLVLARPHAVRFERHDIMSILKDVIMLLDTQAIMNNIELVGHFPERITYIECVDKELKQVFINIIRNAIEAMPNGGKIHIKAEVEQEKITLQFCDQGKGIPEDRLKKIGEPFYTTKEKGTGLGMMVSYKIIESHKGLMKFDSEVNVGTVVTVSLPITQ
ncbi:CheR family methyltransferase [Halalkalibacter akibai]|uniref:Chemotaxis protein methyltransferase CheR n=1 Tax=Halalkalibacter akibai (strain ATCC 43226 / DSM 21942 / CIP 109018 / JCM 9157 / 1139) TaxID=1236973 RepID=W4R1B4_HALA3|nr:CheR family methyltransferase [Halalkalibacter akibai]GAE37349.1 chemotaxis protein methyltransferase CheR [Halalkalibacter akibai JCM 9157]